MHTRKGGCLCGAVRYVLKGEPQATAICHCTHCQKQSGSLFSYNLFVQESDYEQQGDTVFFEDQGDSGQPSYRHFCGQCGSPILTKVALMPGVVLVKAGTLDSLERILPPGTEIYTDRAAEWLSSFKGAKRFPRSP
ncbi:GFA family protein (plasmid) [Caballeronia sp. NK8]|uniref:GFA family protein n=1 Tax=Caballeronia sp. NK8 TaxID=140098 RepID=UPI001BB6746E|nr:GFA family protein [Caballeronia sp. NK8]BCQ28648.1 GFA family protein [Caballeronia sp. NK8]